MNAVRVSVIIPTFRRCASVQRLLQALARQTLPPTDYEVIVVIDGSEDGTRELVAAFPAPYALRAIWQPNQGRATACNAGVYAARGAVVVLLDDDMEPIPSFLAAHLHAHALSERRGIMGAVPIAVDASSPPVVRYIGAKFNEHLQRLAYADHQLQLRDFYSGNFSIPRTLLTDLGGFDEAFKIYGNEDLELSLRLVQAGVQLVYSPDAVAQQQYIKDFAGLARDNFNKGRTAVLLANIHPAAFHDLKLSAYEQGSRKWRMARAALVQASDGWGMLPHAIIRWVQWLERHRPTGMQLWYQFALDYFYWLGVRTALHEAGSSRDELAARARQAMQHSP